MLRKIKSRFKFVTVLPLLTALTWLEVNPSTVAQIAVGTNGSSMETFGSIPPAVRWSTRSIPGVAAAPESETDLDAFINGATNAANTVTAQSGNSSGDPPAAAATAQWSSSGYLITRPVGNAVTLLMASLTNASGLPLNSLRVKYDYTQKLNNSTVANEVIKGHRVYYNLSGTAGQWVPLGTFGNSFTTNIVQAIDFQINLSSIPWSAGAALYVLFADDNSNPGADAANAIDNFRVTNVVAVLAPVIATEPQSTSVAPGQPTTFSVGVQGAQPLFFQWRKNSNDLAGATNATYTIASAQIGDEGFYSVFVSNAFGTKTSAVASLAVGCFTPTALAGQMQDQSLASGATLTLNITATGTAPMAYQWYLNNAPISGATNQSYTKVAALDDSGTYYVRVSNCGGSQTSGRAHVGVAAPPYVLISLTNNIWKYEQSGSDLGTAWRAPNYDDSAWPSGRGILAQEDNAPGIPALTNTVLSLSDGNGARIPTYYFRMHFTLTNDLASIALVASNYFDDGVVVFLNGVEAFRYNIGFGPVVYNTLAPAANPAGEGVFIVSNLPPQLLLEGNNVLAAEIHQNSLTSADIAFGMQVNVVVLAPTVLRFTNQPADITIPEGRSATFTAAAAGNGAHYQWFKEGSPIPGATGLSLTLDNAALASAGNYALQASNVFGVVFSRLARLTVLNDLNPPALLAADWLDATHVNASFSEPLLLLTATNPANYSVSNTLGATLNLVSAALTNGTNVLLTIAGAADASANYILSAAGIADLPPAHSVMPLSAVPIARTVPLIAFDSSWFYYDPYGPPIDNFDPGANWKDENYDTSNWGYDAGAFSYSQNSTFVPPAPVSTTLGPTPGYTTYFRNGFTFALSPGGLGMKLRYAADDGVALYLNGADLLRFNLPPGTLTPQTLPLQGTNAVLVSALNVPIHLFRTGANLLAAELHQSAPSDTDKFFAMELIARAESLPTGPLLVLAGPTDTSVVENQIATFRVSSVAATSFQWRINDADVPGATNSTFSLGTVPLSLNGSQLRCLCAQASGSILTSNATLHVLPDIVRPEFLSAVANADNTLTLSFSKLLSAATAIDVGNYSVTNSAGTSVAVSAATLVNGTNVILTFAAPLAGRCAVVVSNVSDTAATPNAVAPGSAVTVGVDYFVAMDSAWKYLLINTNQLVQSTFMSPTYDDSAWLGPSNALLYVENALLPGPKNTLLSLFDSTGVNRINTYYFRQQWPTPMAGTNVTIRIRHIIDDGMILHLNGKEIYRFNMPPGPATAATQGTPNVGDALLLGPFDILNVTNFAAGTNVLAVEVHQNGAQSPDVVMGVELSVHVPGVRLPSVLEASSARLAITSWGNKFALSWGETGFTLEAAENVAGPWTGLTTSSPFFVPRTNSAAFFRLRQ